MTNLDALLDELHVGADYRPVLERLLACAGQRAADCLQEFCLHLIQGREEGRPCPESVALAGARRWLRRENLDSHLLEPLTLTDAEGKERERRLEPLPAPIPASRRQIKWGRSAQHASIPVPAPDADLRGRCAPCPCRSGGRSKRATALSAPGAAAGGAARCCGWRSGRWRICAKCCRENKLQRICFIESRII